MLFKLPEQGFFGRYNNDEVHCIMYRHFFYNLFKAIEEIDTPSEKDPQIRFPLDAEFQILLRPRPIETTTLTKM